MSSVRLSEKHGFNPTIPVCWWCREPKNEILIIGSASTRLFGTEEAPTRCLVDMVPCDKCIEAARRGEVTIICFKDTIPEHLIKNGHLSQDDLKSLETYRTGHLWRVTLEAAGRVFIDVDLNKQRFLSLSESTARLIGLINPDGTTAEAGK